MNDKQFDRKLIELVARWLIEGTESSYRDATRIVDKLLSLPGVYEILSEDFNNEVLQECDNSED